MTWLLQKFQALSSREKLLCNAFIWVCLMIWFIFTIDGIGGVSQKLGASKQMLQSQQMWLQMKDQVEENLQDSLQRFNPEKTFDSASLIGRVDALARETGVNHDLSTPRSQPGDRFDFHTMRVNVRKSSLSDILAFAKKIRGESPYINLESVKVAADQRNPELIDGQFIIKSFELKNKQ